MATAGEGEGISVRVLLLVASLALGAGMRPCLAAPDGDAKAAGAPARVFDAQIFTQELFESGALKFYDVTEEMLRSGQFERALLRYQFLRGQIGRQAGYRPLAAQVDHRLRFLKGQLRLGDAALASLPLLAKPKASKPEPATKPATPPPPPPPKAAGEEPAAPEPLKEAAKPAKVGSPADTRPAAVAGQAGPEPQEQAAEERPPPPPLSRWEKVKRRLLFWKKKEV